MAYIESTSNFPTAYVRVASQTYVLQHIFQMLRKGQIWEKRPKSGKLLIFYLGCQDRAECGGGAAEEQAAVWPRLQV